MKKKLVRCLRNSLVQYGVKKIYTYLPLILYILISFVLLLISKENISRASVIFGFLTFWYIFGFLKKNFSISSLITLILVFPLHITINIEGLTDPFVNNVLVNYLIPYLSILDLFSFVLVFSYFYEERKFILKTSHIWILLLLILSLLFNPTIFGLLGLIRISLYLIASIYVVLYIEQKNLKTIFITLGISTLLQLLLSIYQVYTKSMLGVSWLGESQVVSGSIGSSFLNLGGQQILRAYGTFPHPNVLALFLLVVIFLSLLYFEKEKKKLVLLLILLAHCNLFLTFSRLSIFIGILLSSTLLINYLKNIKLFSFLLFERFASIFSGTDISVNERLILTKTSIEMILRNPNGIGWGMYIKGLEEFKLRTSSGILLLQPVHNIFQLLMVEHGVLLGLFLSATLVVSWFNRFKALSMWIGIAGFISILTLSSFDHYFLTLPQGILILLLSIV